LHVLVHERVLRDYEWFQLAHANRIIQVPDVRRCSNSDANSNTNTDAHSDSYSDANADTNTGAGRAE
jgi:hypothetical protein